MQRHVLAIGPNSLTVDITGPGSASVYSDLAATDIPANEAYHAALDAIESMVMGQAAAGVDITTQAYQDGLNIAYAKLCDRFTPVELEVGEKLITVFQRANAIVDDEIHYAVPSIDWDALPMSMSNSEKLNNLMSTSTCRLLSRNTKLDDVNTTFECKVLDD